MPLTLVPHIHRATHRIGLHVEALRTPPVTQGEAHVLAFLASTDEPTVGDVHRAFGHKRSTLTSILNRLQDRGLLVRTADAGDRRRLVVSLTPRGRNAARRVVRHLQAFEHGRLRGLPAADIAAFLRVLGRFEE